MLSFANTHLSFYYLLFLLCVAGLVASAPTTHNHNGHHLHSRPFPYGKLADRLLHVNDRNNDVPYMIDNLDEDMVRVYPDFENPSVPSSSGLPIASFEPKLLPVPIPNVGTKDIISFAYRLPDIIKKLVVQEWENTVVRWRTMARDQS
jgi:hypothetical protein